MKARVTFNIRNIYLRSMNTSEKETVSSKEKSMMNDKTMENNLKNYPAETYSAEISSAEVSENAITIRGTCPNGNGLYVAEIHPYTDITETSNFNYKTEIKTSQFNITLERFTDREGFNYDRALSKWTIDKSLQMLHRHEIVVAAIILIYPASAHSDSHLENN